MKIEFFRILLKKKYLRGTAHIRQKRLKVKDFTIISNNCWSGLVYECYGLEKQTPTVGMYFMAEEYIKFVSNLEHYLFECELEFIDPQKAKHKEFYQRDKHYGQYPIALLGDVEIAMLHFHSEEEAKAKWERRCKRVRMDKLIIKMNDQNECTPEIAEAFTNLPYENKVFFTVHDWPSGSCAVRIPHGKSFILTSQEPHGASRYWNVNKAINRLYKG